MLGHRVRHEDRTRPVEADDVRLERNGCLAEVELTFGLSTTDRFSTSDEEDGEVMDADFEEVEEEDEQKRMKVKGTAEKPTPEGPGKSSLYRFFPALRCGRLCTS